MGELSCKLKVKLEVKLSNSHDFGEVSDAVLLRDILFGSSGLKSEPSLA